MEKPKYNDEAQQPLLQNQQHYKQQLPPHYPHVHVHEPVPATVVVHEVGLSSSENTTGLLLFIIGCFFPLVWLFAPCFFHPKTESGRTWRRIMIFLDILSLISLLIVVIVFAVAAVNAPTVPSPSPPSAPPSSDPFPGYPKVPDFPKIS